MSTSTVSSPKKKGVKVSQAKWDDDSTRVLLELFSNEIDIGNRHAGVFTKISWMNIVLKFNECTKLDYNKEQLKNKQDTLRREFSKWERLIAKETGLGWDNEKRTLAAPDTWWLEKAKSDPSILRYRECGPVNLDLLQKVFGGITTTGYRQYIPEEDVSDPLLIHGDALNHLDNIIDFTSDTDLNPPDSTAQMVNNASAAPLVQTNSPAISKLASRKRKKNASNDRMSEADKFSLGMESFTVTMKDNMNVYQASKAADEIAYQDALLTLKSLPGMDPGNTLFLKGVQVLEDRMKRVAFRTMLDYGVEGVEAWLSSL